MSTTNATHKIVKSLPKGQITIPIEFRRALGIDSETLLNVSLVDDHLEITPVVDQAQLRRYTDDEVARFLEEDKLEPDVADKVRELLRHGVL